MSTQIEQNTEALEEILQAVNELPEAGGGGLSSTASALLVTILKNAVYTSNQSANIVALEAALTSGGGSGSGGDTGGGNEGGSGSETTEERIEWQFGGTIDNTTFVYNTLDMSGGAAAVYSSNVITGLIPSDGNTALRFSLDKTKVSKYKFRLYLYNADGTPYKASNSKGSYSETYSGDLTDVIPMRDPGAAGRVFVDGDWTYKIPAGCSALVWVEFADALQNSTILDNSLLDANGKIYGVIDRIAFDGEILNAYVVKEV